MIPYNERTAETIKAEMAEITEASASQLANFLQSWMANKHNGKNFISVLKESDLTPAEKCKAILGSAYDWFAYGN